MDTSQQHCSQLANQRQITLRFLAEPTDINFGGKVHGGAVMKWIDQAGYACAVGWSRQYCVTVYVGGIRFYKPILIGQLVEVDAKIIHTGKTSMHVAVDVNSSDPKDGRYINATQCVVIFVAVDSEGNPIDVKRWEPQTGEDKAREHHAIKLMALRKDIEREIKPYTF